MKTNSNRIRAYSAVGFLLVVAAWPGLAAAQDDFEAYRKQQQQGAQQIRADFQQYKEQQDREFADFLKGRWRGFETSKGDVRIREPEPRQAPTRPAKPGQQVSPPPVSVIPAAPPPVLGQPKPVPVAADELEINFFGNMVRFAYDPQWQRYRLPDGSKPEAMGAFWGMMSASKYEPAVQAVNDARRDLNLDDWGAVTLWRSVAQALQPARKSEQNLLLWFFLVKSGYDVRMGYGGPDVHLFVAMKQRVYSTKYVTVGDRRYYAALAEDRGDSIRTLYTYEAQYPGALKPLDIRAASTAFTKVVPERRALSFNYRGATLRINAPYDRRLAEYLNTFPQADFELYFDTGTSSMLREGLLPELRKHTATMSDEEAVGFLLAFVQYAFAYKTDIEQFGREKCFFIEESLYFPYNDCKDRSVFFAWLVRELVGIKVVGLLYPGHMTTAVALRQVKPEFDTVEYEGQRLVIADPTYIGASVGEAMPSYKGRKPDRVLEISGTPVAAR